MLLCSLVRRPAILPQRTLFCCNHFDTGLPLVLWRYLPRIGHHFEIAFALNIFLGDQMQLKIQRSQRAGGVMGGTVLFCLDVRADYSPEEQGNIGKYKLGSQVIYNSQAARRHLDNAGTHLDRVDNDSMKEKAAGLARGALSMAMAKMSLNISIASLGRGQHIECKDLGELLEAEETVRTACKDLTRYLEAAASFDGSETVIEYVKGEEVVHITQSAPPLLTYSSSEPSPSHTEGSIAASRSPAFNAGQRVGEFWSNPQYRKYAYIGVSVIALLLPLRACF